MNKALVQFIQLSHKTKALAEPLGAVLIMVGLTVLLIGTCTHLEVTVTSALKFSPQEPDGSS